MAISEALRPIEEEKAKERLKKSGRVAGKGVLGGGCLSLGKGAQKTYDDQERFEKGYGVT